ncbi:MAG: amidohydrolase [Bacteroidales bacterium]
MSLQSQDRDLLQKMIEIRGELHLIPEYSHKEEKTAALVTKYLKETSPDYLYTSIGGHGIIAGYQGESQGASLMFRCELDAIMTEKGCNHLCGHDGHMAILLGLSKIVSKNRAFSGTVWLLFQPAEEVGEGAALMVKEMQEKGVKFDFAFSLHNKPGIPLNKVVLHQGVYAAGSVGMELFFKGSPSHAASPEKAVSPYKPIFETANYMHELNSKRELFTDFTLGTVVNISLGDVNYGVTPGEGYLRMTLRSFVDKDLDKLCSLIEGYASEKALENGLKLTTSYFDRFPATLNDAQANKMVERAVIENHIEYEYAKTPEKGSDDFAFFAFNATSSYFDIGNGIETKDLHQQGYKFSDQIMETALVIYRSIIYKN